MFSTLHNAQDVIVELLCTAMVWAYFKSLTNRTPETLAVANEGLRQLHYSLVTSAATLRYLEMSKGRALLILSLLFLLAAFNVVEGYNRLRPRKCKPRCTYRCSVTSHRKPCMFFCQKCCAKCLCSSRHLWQQTNMPLLQSLEDSRRPS
ncbi:uncharacterized protein LOC141724212 isoform X2 [Apium graveolens]